MLLKTEKVNRKRYISYVLSINFTNKFTNFLLIVSTFFFFFSF